MTASPTARENRIVIIGAGGHGRGILEILRAASQQADLPCPVLGFLDDRDELQAGTCGGLPILGRMGHARQWADDGVRFLVGVGDPIVRRRVVRTLDGLRFATAVHPSATLYGEVTVGEGAVIAAGVVVAAATSLGAHALLNLNATVGHDCHLDAFATVAPGSNLGGFVRLGEAAFVGLNATVVPGRVIGREARLGPGSVLLEDLGDRRVAFGLPARVVDRVRSVD